MTDSLVSQYFKTVQIRYRYDKAFPSHDLDLSKEYIIPNLIVKNSISSYKIEASFQNLCSLDKNFILHGESGSGKSCLFKYWRYTATNQKEIKKIPIVISLNSITNLFPIDNELISVTNTEILNEYLKLYKLPELCNKNNLNSILLLIENDGSSKELLPIVEKINCLGVQFVLSTTQLEHNAINETLCEMQIENICTPIILKSILDDNEFQKLSDIYDLEAGVTSILMFKVIHQYAKLTNYKPANYTTLFQNYINYIAQKNDTKELIFLISLYSFVLWKDNETNKPFSVNKLFSLLKSNESIAKNAQINIPSNFFELETQLTNSPFITKHITDEFQFCHDIFMKYFVAYFSYTQGKESPHDNKVFYFFCGFIDSLTDYRSQLYTKLKKTDSISKKRQLICIAFRSINPIIKLNNSFEPILIIAFSICRHLELTRQKISVKESQLENISYTNFPTMALPFLYEEYFEKKSINEILENWDYIELINNIYHDITLVSRTLRVYKNTTNIEIISKIVESAFEYTEQTIKLFLTYGEDSIEFSQHSQLALFSKIQVIKDLIVDIFEYYPEIAEKYYSVCNEYFTHQNKSVYNYHFIKQLLIYQLLPNDKDNIYKSIFKTIYTSNFLYNNYFQLQTFFSNSSHNQTRVLISLLIPLYNTQCANGGVSLSHDRFIFKLLLSVNFIKDKNHPVFEQLLQYFIKYLKPTSDIKLYIYTLEHFETHHFTGGSLDVFLAKICDIDFSKLEDDLLLTVVPFLRKFINNNDIFKIKPSIEKIIKELLTTIDNREKFYQEEILTTCFLISKKISLNNFNLNRFEYYNSLNRISLINKNSFQVENNFLIFPYLNDMKSYDEFNNNSLLNYNLNLYYNYNKEHLLTLSKTLNLPSGEIIYQLQNGEYLLKEKKSIIFFNNESNISLPTVYVYLLVLFEKSLNEEVLSFLKKTIYFIKNNVEQNIISPLHKEFILLNRLCDFVISQLSKINKSYKDKVNAIVRDSWNIFSLIEECEKSLESSFNIEEASILMAQKETQTSTQHKMQEMNSQSYKPLKECKTIEDIRDFILYSSAFFATIYIKDIQQIQIWAIDKIREELYLIKNKSEDNVELLQNHHLTMILKDPQRYQLHFPINWNRNIPHMNGKKKSKKGFGIGYNLLGETIIKSVKPEFCGFTNECFLKLIRNCYLKSNSIQEEIPTDLDSFYPNSITHRIRNKLENIYPQNQSLEITKEKIVCFKSKIPEVKLDKAYFIAIENISLSPLQAFD